MAASGGSILEGSIYKGSGEDFDISCEPCKDDGNFVEALGYCKNCNEYLCLACKKIHCLPKPSRHHVVLDKHEMPQNKPVASKPKVTLCTMTCDKHPTECLKFFCKKHNVTGCGDCMILDHKTCKVDYISTLAEGFNTSTEYTSMIQKVDQLQTEVRDQLADAGQSTAKTESTVKKAIADVKQYRIDVNAYLDKIESNLAAKCNEIKAANLLESKGICDKLSSFSKQLASIHSRLTTHIDNTANLLVWTKELHTMLVALETEMKAIRKSELQCIKFEKNSALTSEILSSTSLGELKVTKLPLFISGQRKRIMDMVPKYKSDISVVDSTDTRKCSITGMVHVRENIIACTDWFNNTVKLVDIKQGKLLHTVSVMNQPWDITSISHDTCAVTITSSSKIQFLEVKNDIVSLKHVIGVNGRCRGIDCVDDKLVVSYDKPPKVEIIDFHGNILKVIQTDNVGTHLFKCPYYVVFSRDGGSIYVSETDGGSVIKLSLDGTVQASYKESDLDETRDMFVCRDGSVLVCSFMSTVHVISGDCKKQKLLLSKKDGVNLPTGISFNEYNGILCVRKRRGDDPDVIQTYVCH